MPGANQCFPLALSVVTEHLKRLATSLKLGEDMFKHRLFARTGAYTDKERLKWHWATLPKQGAASAFAAPVVAPFVVKPTDPRALFVFAA